MTWVNTSPALLLTVAGLGYALGVVNPAHYLVRRRRGFDIRDFGSGNAGATNAGRLLGGWGFLSVLLLDAGKGAAAVCLARWASDDPSLALAALGGAVLGHIWPLHLQFRGGKGVSTLLGGVLATDPGTLVFLIATGWPFFVITRRFVASGLLALAALPLILYVRHADHPQAAGALALVGVVWFAHRHQLEAEFCRSGKRAHPSLDRPTPTP